MRIGYLGLGAMGGALSAHLAKGFDLVVYDRSPEAMAKLVSLGAQAADSAAELARRSDIILLCLPRTSDVQNVLFGSGGLAEGLSAGKLVIDQTSGAPSLTNTIARQLELQGIAMMDAPLSGGIPAAQSGTVTIIASGADEAWTRAEPVLRAMTSKVFRCSARVGDAQALKLVNNAIGAGYRMATLELVALGRKVGLNLSVMVDALNASDAANFTSRNMLAGLVEGRSTTNFALSLMVKDLNEAMALGAATTAAMPMTAGARALMQIGLNVLGKDARLDDVIPLTEKLADVVLKGDGPSAPSNEVEFLGAIMSVTILCNTIAVFECIAMGAKFGLPITEMARILNVGSAWSAASEKILLALANNAAPQFGITLGEVAKAAKLAMGLSASAGVPLLLPNIALGYLQSALNAMEETADLGALNILFSKV